jgi:hypothetical protein
MTQTTMTRDQLIRNHAATVASRRQASLDAAAAQAADHQASLAAGAAEVAALVNMGAFYCGAEGTTRKSRYASSATITVLSHDHGERPSSLVNIRKFEVLKSGITVCDAHLLGTDNGYLRRYVERGLIAIA